MDAVDRGRFFQTINSDANNDRDTNIQAASAIDDQVRRVPTVTAELDQKEAIAYIHDGMHVFANDAYIQLFKYSELDEILATPFMDMVAEACRKDLKLSLRSCQKSGDAIVDDQHSARLELVGLDANKTTFPVSFSLKPTFYEGEHCLQVIVTGELQVVAEPIVTDTKKAAENRIVVKKRKARNTTNGLAPNVLALADIASALQQNDLFLVYQPVVSTAANEPQFYEIHPQMRGRSQQIYTTEQITSIIGDDVLGAQLDRWTGARAIAMFGNLCRDGKAPQFQLTINAATIRDTSFGNWLVSQLAVNGVAAGLLVLNMREHDVLADTARSVVLIKNLHAAGVRACISGFTNNEAIAAIVTDCKIRIVRFDNGINEAEFRDMLSLSDLKHLVDSLHKNAVKVIAAEVHDRDTAYCLWLAEVDLVQGALFQGEAQELQATSFRGPAYPPTNVV
jgi:EAL domain-containing protein (putative c-di-GMP-specific phosphodiesterase class I)